jgi:hypothetical protein
MAKQLLTADGKRKRMQQAIIMLRPQDHDRLVAYAESQDSTLSEVGRLMILTQLAELEPVYWIEPGVPVPERTQR